jgi:fatty acid desaturase
VQAGSQEPGDLTSTFFAKENANMLWTILVVLLVLWLLGLIGGIGGSLIHLLLVVALIVLVVNLLTGRRTV